MRKSLITILSTAVVLLNTTAVFASTIDEYWQIKEFHSDITINTNGTFQVTEKITADFTNEAHRGIGRVIPLNDTEIEFISSVDENGNQWYNTIRHYSGNIDIESLNQELEYRNDINTYLITYLVKYGYKFFDDHDELHWNVNGTEWPVTADQVSATVHIPESLTQDQIQLTCNTGFYGSTDQNCEYKFIDEHTIQFTATKPFNRYENLTIAVGMPAGTIQKPSPSELRNKKLQEYIPLLIPFFVTLIMFFLWFTKGRDEKAIKNTIIPHYTAPEGISPTETGIIFDEALDPQDITATIIEFAIKGYIQIHEVELKVLFIKTTQYILELKKPYETTKKFQKLILEGIFPLNEAGIKVNTESLKTTFHKHMPAIEKEVINDLISQNYFPHNPMTIKKVYTFIASIFFIITFQVIALGPIYIATFLLTALSIYGFGKNMPRRTMKGAETYFKLKGLYEYIKTAEKDRIKFQEDANIMFEKLMPYAIAFGLAEKWSKVFADIIKTPPSWFTSNANHFSIMNFSHSLNSFTNNFTQTTQEPSKSSGFGGGGFSGGGGGGGGGGGR
ncbi:hypothetical protein COU74_00865 [Candidatus Peregrinibacteria bacterium CG10_big_fil_rev_8_21_14_0_10_36_19]|nr:MAG: hypothetical protein COU74_00865 [Candidatus Peregrinibacteria bacterium CG10_big_fil_rev_8_21_14_0_10_36_19]